MKNLITYYIVILAPLLLIILLKPGINKNPIFASLILFYAFVYRTITDGIRLYQKNIIPKKDIWKLVIPGTRILHFKELYLK